MRSRSPNSTACVRPRACSSVTVLADAGYGSSAAFRHAPRRARPALGGRHRRAPRRSTPPTSPLVPPPGPRAQSPCPGPGAARTAEAVLWQNVAWRRVTWRQGTERPWLSRPRVSALIRAPGGATARSAATTAICPGEEVWLVGEWRTVRRAQVLPVQPAVPGQPGGRWPARSRHAGCASRPTSR